MSGQTKLQKILELMLYLSNGLRYTRKEISDRFKIDERTVFRYISDLREVGFIIPEAKDGLYYIDHKSQYFKDFSELLHFSKEEAVILQNAIHSINDENLLKQNLVKKLYALYDFDRVPDTIVKPEHSVNIHELIKAIKCKTKVILRGYLSANSKQLRDRVVEPFNFTTNYISIWAYDIEAGCCKIFKNTRISSVQVLKEPWENADKHEVLPTDVFRISSSEQTDIKLKLSVRAVELLREEYPLSEQYITQLDNNQFEFEAPVSNFDGVGRFIMGLSDEIEIVNPQELKEFIKNKAKNILTV